MKKIIKIILLFCFLFLIVFPVFADKECPTCGQTGISPSDIVEGENVPVLETKERRVELRELRQNVIEKREIIRERIQKKRATIAARLAEKRKERIRAFFERLVTRIQAAINRLEKLIGRIESRLSKIEEVDEDIDTAPIRETLDEAKGKLAEASAALSEAKTSLEDILSSDNPKEMFTDVRDLIKGIKQQLVEVHRLLVHVIGDIKGLRVGQRSPQPVVTPSPEVTPEGE